ncbi:Dyp-type peroxidase [Ceratobasidium sp. AG-I]|nr:Dyp-type peroxidase [Ceratobasidium sp. AG-I]
MSKVQAPMVSGHDQDHDHDHDSKNPLGECNIQGDAILRLPKKREDFIFFNITDLAGFRPALRKLSDKVTCARRTKGAREAIMEFKSTQPKESKEKPRLPAKLLNIAFSKDGITKLGFDPKELKDGEFAAGQRAAAESLGDPRKAGSGPYVPDWDPVFQDPIDGLIILATESDKSSEELTKEVNAILGTTVKKVYVLKGTVRTPPGQEKHEHFGWLDGISQPFLKGLSMNKPNPGQRVVDPGVIILGAEGDSLKDERPDWGLDGSFLVFRKLHQNVPQFQKFIQDNPVIGTNGIPIEGGSALRCAQFFGRWESGAPIVKHPTSDPGAKIGADSKTNNDFVFQPGNQELCPYSAHIRKMNPRDPTGMPPHHLEHTSIVRAGIPYGPEVKKGEDPKTERGLAFVCYQSRIANGFVMQQQNWANNQNFPVKAATAGVAPGFDPIIGQAGGATRTTVETNGNHLSGIPQFVMPRGGCYFFSPSIWALRHRLSASS